MEDFDKYETIEQIYEDIVAIKIQGATNVAIATFKGLRLYASTKGFKGLSKEQVIDIIIEKGNYLAEARPNEPLATNGVRFVAGGIKESSEAGDYAPIVISLCNEYLLLIDRGKRAIIENSEEVFKVFEEENNRPVHGIFTHCHSSTAVNVIKAYSDRVGGAVEVACTETRPLYQGRKTAKKLVEYGIDTTMVADSSAESFIIDRGTFDIDMTFIGVDQITSDGCMINKIGSFGVALASKFDNDPLYVVGSILKTNIDSTKESFKIEMREGTEIWEDAPHGLKIVNPAFELVDARFITGFITEHGVLSPSEILPVLKENYKWLFET